MPQSPAADLVAMIGGGQMGSGIARPSTRPVRPSPSFRRFVRRPTARLIGEGLKISRNTT
jgi:hypothetical protein